MFNLLVRGWRNINHSIALVNQYHLLAFTQRTDLQIFHEDMPFASPDWNPATNAAGFDAEQQARISTLPGPGLEDMDAILSIAVPFSPFTRRCNRQVTFIVTEFGLQESDFAAGWYSHHLVTRDAWVMVMEWVIVNMVIFQHNATS